MNQTVIGSVFRVGDSVINSSEFKAAYCQIHHKTTTVGDHSFYVACASLCICNFLGHIGINTNKKDMINAALCHDLGILGRSEKFSSSMQMMKEHPKDSVPIAREILGEDDNKRVEDIISHHMWPATPLSFPRSREAYVITVADKYCAVMERLFKKKMPRREEFMTL